MSLKVLKNNKKYWPIIIIGLLLISFFWPAPTDILSNLEFSNVVRGSSGETLRVFLTEDDKYRIWVDISRYPPDLIEALLLKEDKLFYSHHGVNFTSLFKAGYVTYIKKGRRVGASTLTMQLVRLRDKVYTKNVLGKLIQVYKAIYMDMHYTKQEILEAYLNLAPCGGNIEGFGTASEFYFHKQPVELTLSEILFLVVLPQNPEVRSPKNKRIPQVTIDARISLFNKWLNKNSEDKDRALTMRMPTMIEGSFPFIAPHASEYITENFTAYKGNYNSTINSNYQNLVKTRLNNYIRENRENGVNNGSILVMDYNTGNVVCAVGSNNYFDNEIQGQVKGFNAKRSPGSTLKPFIYALGIDQGVIHPQTMLKDSPQTFGVYTPDNFNSSFKGPIFAWQALVESKNIPAINIANSLSNPDLYDFLKKSNVSGLKEKGYYGLSIVLGSAEVTMLELVSMYGALVNEGRLTPPVFLKNYTKYKPIQLLSKEASYLTWEMLKKNPSPVKYRPKENKDYPIAYKTGTSIGFKDSWSVGIFDDYVIAVWIGNFDGRGNNSFIGRKMAAPLLFSIADTLLLEKQPKPKFSKLYKSIKRVDVCSISGCIPNSFCPTTVSTDFIPGVSPISKCHIHREVFIDSRTGYRTDDKYSEYTKREVREFWTTDLLELFENAGLPRLKPPPYPPENGMTIKNSGFPPRINSPLDGGEYIIRRDNKRHNSIILVASADVDSKKLYWFANGAFLGSGSSKSQIEWVPKAGSYTITSVDDMGRSDSINIIVTQSD